MCKKINWFILLIAVLVVIFATTSCDDSSENPVEMGYSVTESQWKKSFGDTSISKGTVASNIAKYGFDNGTVIIASKGEEDHFTYEIEHKMYFGDGFICDQNGAICMGYSANTDKWYYCYPIFKDIPALASLSTWNEYTSSGDFENKESGTSMDSCFDDVLSAGSEAPLAYMCAWRNYLGTDGLNLKDCYNKKYFDEAEGMYKFGLKFEEPEVFEDFENIDYELVGYEESDYKVSVKFDSAGNLVDVKFIENGNYTEFKFTEYNTTTKPSFFPRLNY